jgi:hypothetical protein
MNRLAQDITGIRTAVTMKRELEDHRERERSFSGSDHAEEDENAREIMDSFQEHVGPSLTALAVRKFSYIPHIVVTNTAGQDVARNNLRTLRTSFLQSKAGTKEGSIPAADDLEAHGITDTSQMAAQLQTALDAYHAVHTKALRKLYRHFPSALDGQISKTIESYRAMDSRP